MTFTDYLISPFCRVPLPLVLVNFEFESGYLAYVPLGNLRALCSGHVLLESVETLWVWPVTLSWVYSVPMWT